MERGPVGSCTGEVKALCWNACLDASPTSLVLPLTSASLKARRGSRESPGRGTRTKAGG